MPRAFPVVRFFSLLPALGFLEEQVSKVEPGMGICDIVPHISAYEERLPEG